MSALNLERYAYSLPTELCNELRALFKRVRELEEALQFYAAFRHWDDEELTPEMKNYMGVNAEGAGDALKDRGTRARDALNRGSGKSGARGETFNLPTHLCPKMPKDEWAMITPAQTQCPYCGEALNRGSKG